MWRPIRRAGKEIIGRAGKIKEERKETKLKAGVQSEPFINSIITTKHDMVLCVCVCVCVCVAHGWHLGHNIKFLPLQLPEWHIGRVDWLKMAHIIPQTEIELHCQHGRVFTPLHQCEL